MLHCAGFAIHLFTHIHTAHLCSTFSLTHITHQSHTVGTLSTIWGSVSCPMKRRHVECRRLGSEWPRPARPSEPQPPSGQFSFFSCHITTCKMWHAVEMCLCSCCYLCDYTTMFVPYYQEDEYFFTHMYFVVYKVNFLLLKWIVNNTWSYINTGQF